MGSDRGLVFHVIHGSFVDGYGIRTTVFLKGCPLRCIWCCNPEGQSGRPEIKFTSALCDGCGKCLRVCPEGAICPASGNGSGRVAVNRKLCTGCGKCAEVCSRGALDIFGRYYTVDELFALVKKDEQFYRRSGGGVTLGGGEATFQPSFTRRFIKKCRENYIHVALDTCGYTTTDEGMKALEEADLLLFDLKGMDSGEHLKNTGVPNEPVLNNLRRLSAMGKAIIVRIPVIPGYTDTRGNLRAAAEFLAGLKSVERVDLLAYHEYGKAKYEQLGKEYRLKNVQNISSERMEEIKALFESYGLNVQLGG